MPRRRSCQLPKKHVLSKQFLPVMSLSARGTVCQIIRPLSAKNCEQGYRVKFTITLNQSSGAGHQHDYHLNQYLQHSPRSLRRCRRRPTSASPCRPPAPGIPHEMPDDNFSRAGGFAIKQQRTRASLHRAICPCSRGNKTSAHGGGDARPWWRR